MSSFELAIGAKEVHEEISNRVAKQKRWQVLRSWCDFYLILVSRVDFGNGKTLPYGRLTVVVSGATAMNFTPELLRQSLWVACCSPAANKKKWGKVN